MLTKENNYDFRKRLQEIHEKNIRNNKLVPSGDELELVNGLTVFIPEYAGDVIITAAKDFIDYLFTSMGISAMLKYGKVAKDGDIVLCVADKENITLTDGNGYRGYRITADNTVSVCGFDERGVAQALFALEDIMSIRKAPFIPKTVIEKRPAFSPQMIHSGYGLDEYPDDYLLRVAHEGRDAILIFVKDVDITPYGYLDFNDLIHRAAKYGIGVYAYSYLKSEKHPDEADAEEYYENNYGKLFRKCPGLKGVTLVGESVEFPSKDPHITGKSYRENLVDGIPTGKTSPGWYPCEDFPQWLNLIKKVVRKYKSDADIVFWTYNWGFRPEEDRIKLIESLPTDITLQATFEMFESRNLDGVTMSCADYTLSFEGYGGYFRSEAIAAAKRGIKLHSMTNTGGLTWDIGVIPYEPFPYQWMKRYEKMREAHEKWNLTGLMESHHFGFYPSIISKLSKMAFMKPWDDMEKLLKTILIGEYGESAADKADAALRVWSDAITYYTATDADQYGAFRIGPSYPFCLNKKITPISAPYSMFGSSICEVEYIPSDAGFVSAGVRDSLISVRIHKEAESLKKMQALISEGLDILMSIEEKNDKLLYLINLGQFIEKCIITGIHAKEWHILRMSLRSESDREKLSVIIDDMEALLLAERKNAEETIPLVQLDSRLGWEPSMEYMTDEEHLLWKNRQVNYVLSYEIENTRKALSL